MGKSAMTLVEEGAIPVRDDSMLKLCSSVFTAKNINHTAWYGHTEINRDASRALEAAGWFRATQTLSDLIDSAYAFLRRHRRCQYFFKNTLLEKTVFGKYSPNTTAWFPEFKVCEARADAVLVNGCATVYEIKTEFDDFSRFRAQYDSYYLCFPRVVLLIDPKHAVAAERNAPIHAGIAILTPRLTIKTLREPTYFPDHLSSAAMFRLLRKKEYQALARSSGLEPLSICPRRRFDLVGAKLSQMPPIELHEKLVEFLRARAPASSLSSLAERVPRPLTAALYEYRVRKSDWNALLGRLDGAVSSH